MTGAAADADGELASMLSAHGAAVVAPGPTGGDPCALLGEAVDRYGRVDALITDRAGLLVGVRAAEAHWRRPAGDGPVAGRLITTASLTEMAGVEAYTVLAAPRLARLGVTANAVVPAALARLSRQGQFAALGDDVVTRFAPRWMAPIVTWLVSTESGGVTGQVFDVTGRTLALADGWRPGPGARALRDPVRLGPVVVDLVERARPGAERSRISAG